MPVGIYTNHQETCRQQKPRGAAYISQILPLLGNICRTLAHFEQYMPHLTWLNVRIGFAGERQGLIFLFELLRLAPVRLMTFVSNRFDTSHFDVLRTDDDIVFNRQNSGRNF